MQPEDLPEAWRHIPPVNEPKPIKPLEPGIHLDMPAEEYHASRLGVVSNTAIKRILQSPAHYRHWLDAEAVDTEALAFGRMFETALLEPEKLSDYITVPDFGDCRFKENKKCRDEWRANHAGMTWVEDDSLKTARAMVEAVKAHPLARKMLDGIVQESIVWKDPNTGLLCKARSDLRSPKHRMVLDVKTCADASENGFTRAVTKYGYHVQNALYREGYAELGEDVEHFVFLAVEKEPPYAVAVYSLDAEAVGVGYRKVVRGRELMAHCMRTNEWPGYSNHIQQLSLPPWAA